MYDMHQLYLNGLVMTENRFVREGIDKRINELLFSKEITEVKHKIKIM